MPVCISPSQTTKGFTQHERRRRNSSLRRRLQAVANIVQLYASLPKDHTTKLQQKCLPNCNIENASLQKCNTIINPLHFDFDSSFQPFFAFIKFSLTTYGVLLPQRKSNTTCPGSSILPSITRILADTPTSPTGLGLVEWRSHLHRGEADTNTRYDTDTPDAFTTVPSTKVIFPGWFASLNRQTALAVPCCLLTYCLSCLFFFFFPLHVGLLFGAGYGLL